MSIHQFISKWNAETSKYEGDFVDFAHGTTIFVGSRSVQIMSDVWGTELYAEYWDDNSNSVKTAHLDTFEWSRSNKEYGLAEATVDATEEVWKKVEAYHAEHAFKNLFDKAQKHANQIVKGSSVRVYGGRTAKGTEGKVVVILERPYGMGYRCSMENKLGIATSDVMIEKEVNGKVYQNHRDIVWVWQRNCELTVVPTFDETPLREEAAKLAYLHVERLRRVNVKKAA